MRRIWKAAAAALLIAALTAIPILQTTGATLGGSGKPMDWQAFLAAYAAVCRTGGAVELTGRLTIPEDFSFAPTARPVVIDAGEHTITTARDAVVEIDNPRLTFLGDGAVMATLAPMNTLRLNACTIRVKDCAALSLPNVTFLDMSAATGVRIEAAYSENMAGTAAIDTLTVSTDPLRLRALELTADGSFAAVSAGGPVELAGCRVTVTGGRAIRAVEARPITAVTTDAASVLSPPLLTEPPAYRYEATMVDETRSMQVFSGIRAEDLPLPETVDVTMENPMEPGDDVYFQPIPLTWDLSALPAVLTAGAYTVSGELAPRALEEWNAVNPKGLKAVCSIRVEDPGPITVWRVEAGFRPLNEDIRLVVHLPWLEGATAVYAEYSLDKESWSRALDDGEENLLVDQQDMQDERDRYTLMGNIPLSPTRTTQFYLRVRVEGSAFEGLSTVLLIKKAGENSTFEEDIGGDRGGGQNSPGREPPKATVRPTTAPSAPTVVTASSRPSVAAESAPAAPVHAAATGETPIAPWLLLSFVAALCAGGSLLRKKRRSE